MCMSCFIVYMKQGRLWYELECASLVIYVVCVLLLFIKKVIIASPLSTSFSNGVHGLFPFFFFFKLFNP